MKNQKKSLLRILSIVTLAGIVGFQALLPASVSAVQITNRSLTLQTGTTTSDVNGDALPDGGSTPGGTANHLFEFDISNHDTAGAPPNGLASIRFEYCTTAAAVPAGIDCNAPTGVDASSAALGNETGATGFSVLSTSQNEVVLSRSIADALGSVSYRLDNIVNPTTTNETFFVRITTYSSADATTGEVDTGTVAASTATQIELDGTMPESLVFCTGGTVGTNVVSGLPDCSTATSGIVSFDKLFSPEDTAIATSQMAASTNAGFGYAITVNGPTMTSGSNTIDAMNTATTSQQSVSQFGMNLAVNTAPIVGQAIAPDSGTSPTDTYTGQAVGNYAIPDTFAYTDGATVADSAATGTDSQIFTASYIVNVPGSQPAGTYTTTLTYICTPTF